MMPAAPTTAALKQEYEVSKQAVLEYFGRSLACLIAGGMGAVMWKADKLSYKNFCCLAAAVSAIGLFNLYKWKQAGKHMSTCFWSLHERIKQDNQKLFDKVFPVASQYLLDNAVVGLFRTTDNSSNDDTIEALKQGQISAKRTPLGVAIDLKRLFQKAAIVGRDLTVDQRRQVYTFAQALVDKQLQDPQTRRPLTWESYVRAWPGELPDAYGETPAQIQHITRNQPWLCEGGLLDLATAAATALGRKLQYQIWTGTRI